MQVMPPLDDCQNDSAQKALFFAATALC